MSTPPKCTECGQMHMAGANGAIYCCGPLLRSVQTLGLYKDSKYFVDMSCRYSPERILADYQLFSACKKNESSVKHLTNFVENHFDQPGTELDYWCPPDYRSEPCFAANIKDPELKKFALDLNRIWKQLGRNMKDCVRTSSPMYSLVYVPNPFIVPGGRFIEFYYWDTYWIVRGLLFSGMHQTARGMIDNLLYLVKQFQMVPGSNRVYYWGRSQPPLLVPMVKSYVEFTRDENYAQQCLPMLECEMDNFLRSHAVQVEGRTMYVYRDKSTGPRPEALREDEASAEGFSCPEDKEEHYAHIKAACESGQAFSSRWFISPCGTNVGTLANIKTCWIVPVELNCILFRSCKTLAEFNVKAGNEEKAQKYRSIACSLIKAITAVLWNEERGVWLDYDMMNRKPRDYFVVTNLSPLWMHAYPIADAEKITASVLAYIEENKLDSYPGGVPHTLSNTGQLWDYPNVFPPMMLMLIDGLNNLGTPEAMEMSKRWRERWVLSNYESYSKTNFMYEKYNCEEFGLADSCAAGADQTGFGWTNGVLIELLARYGHEIFLTNDDEGICTCNDDNISDGLQNCPITSDAYLEKKAAEDAEAYAKMCAENDGEKNCEQALAYPESSFATSEQNVCNPCQEQPPTKSSAQATGQSGMSKQSPCQQQQQQQQQQKQQSPCQQQQQQPQQASSQPRSNRASQQVDCFGQQGGAQAGQAYPPSQGQSGGYKTKEMQQDICSCCDEAAVAAPELSPSEQDNIDAICKCSGENDNSANCGKDPDAELDDDECYCNAMSPKPITTNMIFPLADARSCNTKSQQVLLTEEDSGCDCDKKARAQSDARKSGQE